jgi:predicted secreted protein
MKKTMLLVLALAFGLVTEQANADFTFGEPLNLKSVIPVLDSAHESMNCFSGDGLDMYIGSDRPGGSGNYDLWVLRRNSIDEDWGPPENLGPAVNSLNSDAMPSVSTDGLALYFNSDRPGGYGRHDIWMATRATKDDFWGAPVNLGPKVNSSSSDADPWISSDGLELYYNSYRDGGYGSGDIYVTRRTSTSAPWGEPANLGHVVNSEYDECDACLSHDGLLFFFSGTYYGPVRPGGYGGADIWMTRRTTVSVPWQEPVNLGPKVNIATHDFLPRISPDGSMLYFTTLTVGTWDNWQAPIIPICDFSGDGIVDAADMCIMVDHWHTDYPLCDIGPFAWGDGIVDVQDLIVLAEHLFEVYPSAETVDVNETDDGGQVELELGKLLVVTLESNPSTGYRWELIENNESILKQFGQVEFKPSETSEPPMVGAGGWEIFRFKAISAGQMTLELIYHRSWENVEPLKTFSIQVVVP